MSATGTEAQITRALLRHLQHLILSTPLPVAFPDVQFDRPAFGMWLEAQIFPAPTVGLSVENTGSNSYSGFMQITVVAPQNVGVIASQQVVAEIISWFRRGTVLLDGPTKVSLVKAPYPSPLIMDPPYTRTPVTIPYITLAVQPA